MTKAATTGFGSREVAVKGFKCNAIAEVSASVMRNLIGNCLVVGFCVLPLRSQDFTSEVHRLSRSFETNLEYEYILTFPSGYESNLEVDWPLILYLHGGGTPKLDRYKSRLSAFSNLPAIVLAPLCPPSPDGPLYSNWHWKMLGELVREVSETHRVDPKRRTVMGHSMGGSAAWEMPFHEPDLFTKSVVIAGVAHPWSLRHFPKIPVWVFVGAEDYMRKEQQETVTSAKRFGVDVVETVWPEADHGGVLGRAKNYSRLLDWLVTDAELRKALPPEEKE